MPPNRLDRRTFLAGGLALGALVACGPSGPRAERLGVRFPDGFRTDYTAAAAGSGPQRFPFVVIADDGLPLIETAPDSVEITVLHEGDVVAVETVGIRGAGQFTPYYPLVFTPPRAGRYVARPDFGDLSVEFMVSERDDVAALQVGETLPGFDTPTFSDARGVDPVCTRSEPCPFHELTLAEALANDRPTVLLIATPEFCQTDVCGPSVEFLIDAAAGRPDIDFVHAEVFADPRSAEPTSFPELAPLLVAWDVRFEPSLYVADGNGTIVETRHFAFDRNEVADAVASV